MSRASLDLSDPAAFSRWLTSLRSAFLDADAVSIDLLRPLRARELGPVVAARNYGEARTAVLAALDIDIDVEHGDPVGSGGSPAE